MNELNLATACRIADAAIAFARTRSMRPITVAVLDAGGHTIVLKREDGASILRPQMAEAKAWGALGLGYGSRELVRRNQNTPTFYTALNVTSGGKILPVLGGVLIRDSAGEIVGAVGITGDSQENDDACGVTGVASAGLAPDNGDAIGQ
jgi:uncharacterized protein GlcG (DUF336 family)